MKLLLNKTVKKQHKIKKKPKRTNKASGEEDKDSDGVSNELDSSEEEKDSPDVINIPEELKAVKRQIGKLKKEIRE
jgi:hypothetical protein